MKLERSIGNLAKKLDKLDPLPPILHVPSSNNMTGLSCWKGKPIIALEDGIQIQEASIAIACDILSTCIKQAGVSCILHLVRYVNLTGISLLNRDKLQVMSLGNAFEQRLSAA